MIAFDTNILVYAHFRDYPLHVAARDAIAAVAAGPSTWAIPWPCVHEFYSKVTSDRIHRPPSSPRQAWSQIDAWLEAPNVRLLTEGHDHVQYLRTLTTASGVSGAMVHDARIAAICLSHGVSELITMDRDFARYPQLRTRSLLSS